MSRQAPDLERIDPVIHSPVRLAIMAMLASGDEIDFTYFRDRLGVTDGNLASHLRKLETKGYVKCLKSFLGRKPRTAYRITSKGRQAFERHVTGLGEIVNVERKKK